MERKWYAVCTRGKSERIVHEALKHDFESYLPLQEVRRKWSDRIKKLIVPLVPSYVFVRMLEDERQHVYRIPQVAWILSRKGRIHPIPEKEIEVVRLVEESRMPFQFNNDRFAFRAGDRVRFNTGVLMGSEGFVVRHANNTKVYVRVPSLQGAFELEVSVDAKELSPDFSHLSTEETLALRQARAA